MTGLLIWKEPDGEKRKKPVLVREELVLHTRFLCAEILRTPRAPERILRRRVLTAERRLQKAGVTEVVLPEGVSGADALKGVQPVSTLPLRQALAADWVRTELERRGQKNTSARVAVSADELTGEVVRTVTELVLRHRYVLLDVPYGGEELCRSLRREFGVSLLLAEEHTEAAEVDVQVLFAPRKQGQKNKLVLPLYDETVPLPMPVLPPVLEEKLPRGADRLQLLAALVRAGTIRVGTDLTFG